MKRLKREPTLPFPSSLSEEKNPHDILAKIFARNPDKIAGIESTDIRSRMKDIVEDKDIALHFGAFEELEDS